MKRRKEEEKEEKEEEAKKRYGYMTFVWIFGVGMDSCMEFVRIFGFI